MYTSRAKLVTEGGWYYDTAGNQPHTYFAGSPT